MNGSDKQALLHFVPLPLVRGCQQILRRNHAECHLWQADSDFLESWDEEDMKRVPTLSEISDIGHGYLLFPFCLFPVTLKISETYKGGRWPHYPLSLPIYYMQGSCSENKNELWGQSRGFQLRKKTFALSSKIPMPLRSPQEWLNLANMGPPVTKHHLLGTVDSPASSWQVEASLPTSWHSVDSKTPALFAVFSVRHSPWETFLLNAVDPSFD